MRSYKFRIYPSKQQEAVLLQHLHLSADLWNSLLSQTKEKYRLEGKFYSKSELQKMTKNSSLYAQTAQAVSHRLYSAIQRKINSKKLGQRWGFPRFKTIWQMKSLYYPQYGFSLSEKLNVSPFGKIAVVKHRQIEGGAKKLTLKRESSGRWFAIFYAEVEPRPPKQNTGPEVGLDLGLTNFAVLSDGNTLKNPRHLKKWEKKLAASHRRLSSKKKDSKNRTKAKLMMARRYEKIANCRHDFLHKAANRLLSSYSLIALEKLQIQSMTEQKYGKWINDAAWKSFANILAYKAGSAGCRLVFVDPKNTSQECSACGTIVKKTLWERQHNCMTCGLRIDRDINASINILKRATAGIAGSNACGNGTGVSSQKQEACASAQAIHVLKGYGA